MTYRPLSGRIRPCVFPPIRPKKRPFFLNKFQIRTQQKVKPGEMLCEGIKPLNLYICSNICRDFGFFWKILGKYLSQAGCKFVGSKVIVQYNSSCLFFSSGNTEGSSNDHQLRRADLTTRMSRVTVLPPAFSPRSATVPGRPHVSFHPSPSSHTDLQRQRKFS